MKHYGNIFIDKATLKAAEENTNNAIKKAHEAKMWFFGSTPKRSLYYMDRS